MTGPDDESKAIAWVQAAAAGDRAALGALYDNFAPVLLAIGVRIVGDRREAEDVLHDVFVEVWKSASTFDPTRGRVRTWLSVRMRSRCLDRQKSARIKRNDGDAPLAVVAAEPATTSPDHPKVRRALEALSAEQRQVIEGAYFDGLSCSEIADRDGIPIGTVKSRVAAALTKLRREFDLAPEAGR